MNYDPAHYQKIVDAEVARISSESMSWIHELPMHSEYKFEYSGEEFDGIIQHLPEVPGRKMGSFMLAISITLSPLVYKRFTSGFRFENEKIVLVTSDELKLSEYY